MTLAALIRGKRVSDSEQSATATPATSATHEAGKGGTVATVATVAVANTQRAKVDGPVKAGTGPLSDPVAEARRSRVLAMLADRQGVRYAVLNDTEADPEAVILALAIRGAMPDGGTVTCELRIPREKYDPFLLFDLIARHGGTVH